MWSIDLLLIAGFYCHFHMIKEMEKSSECSSTTNIILKRTVLAGEIHKGSTICLMFTQKATNSEKQQNFTDWGVLLY